MKTTLAMLATLALTTAHSQVIFTDDFTGSASPQWSNLRGDWTVVDGAYSAMAPNNNPPTFTGLPFVLENFALDVDVRQVADGGIWLRSDASGTNGVLLVTGGNGWGNGLRGGNAGRSLYWHVITPQNWSNPPKYNEAFQVFANPGVDNVHLRIEVVGDLYSVFLNGSSNALTSLLETNATDRSGHVGLYDFSEQSFDNLVLEVPPGFGPYRLHIKRADPQHVILSWPTNAIGWNLQSTPSPDSGGWAPVTDTAGITGTNFFLRVQTDTARFYRLHKP